jgi:hypothetical protein
VVGGPPHDLWSDAETKLGEIELIDEDIDHPHRVVFGNIIFQLRGKHRSLHPVRASHEASHRISPSLAEGILR